MLLHNPFVLKEPEQKTAGPKPDGLFLSHSCRCTCGEGLMDMRMPGEEECYEIRGLSAAFFN